MEMKKYKLGDIAKICNGSTPSTKDKLNYDGEIVWATPKDLSEQKCKYFYKGSRNISKQGFKSCSTQLIAPNNILMSSRAPIGLLAINKVECCTNQGFKNIVLNKNFADVEYFFYYLKYNINKIVSLGNGTTFKEISKDSLEKWELSIPTLEVQTRIASVLSAIDNKIALNIKINKELEAMAKELYDYWFVQFDFPNEEGKPYKTSGGKMVYNEVLKREIPAGWEVKKVKDILKVLTGKEDSNFATKNGPYKFFTCSSDIYNCDIFAFEGNAVLIAGNGDFNIKHYSGRFNAYQRTYVLIPEDVKYYAELFLVSSRLVASFRKGSQGSIVKFITKGDIENIKILLPKNESILYDLNQYLFLIEKIQTEIEKLTKLRDFLLPLLMNGQVEVKD